MRNALRAATAVALATIMASAATPASAKVQRSTVTYDSFERPGGYTLADYAAKWANPYGLGEMALTDTRNFAGGSFNVAATPFRTGSDVGVFDHLKYIAISNAAFPVPARGTVTFSSRIRAATPGTVDGLVQRGVFGPSGTWTDPDAPPIGFAPYTARVLEGQQAGAVMNVVDFCTGQLFDWFVSGDTAFALIERLPTAVTANTSNPNCPGATEVGRDKMYTQIVREVRVKAGVSHRVSIAYTRKHGRGRVEYRIDGKLVARVFNVGIPLDRQRKHYTGIYPSLGPGEQLGDEIDSLALGHGLFSLIDAFPFQHPDAPQLSVSIPVGTADPADAGRARLFGQGASASFDDFTVTTVGKIAKVGKGASVGKGKRAHKPA